mmetsp:Transcript_2314/g.6505  ORF Transcript_2314/g.6505 Transcript_2314/m.6505 type:complete len:234 (-) Transcript_2314:46-747(-)
MASMRSSTKAWFRLKRTIAGSFRCTASVGMARTRSGCRSEKAACTPGGTIALAEEQRPQREASWEAAKAGPKIRRPSRATTAYGSVARRRERNPTSVLGGGRDSTSLALSSASFSAKFFSSAACRALLSPSAAACSCSAVTLEDRFWKSSRRNSSSERRPWTSQVQSAMTSSTYLRLILASSISSRAACSRSASKPGESGAASRANSCLRVSVRRSARSASSRATCAQSSIAA